MKCTKKLFAKRPNSKTVNNISTKKKQSLQKPWRTQKRQSIKRDGEDGDWWGKQ